MLPILVKKTNQTKKAKQKTCSSVMPAKLPKEMLLCTEVCSEIAEILGL